MNNLYVRLAKNNLKNNKSLYVPYMVAGMITVLMFYIMMFINNSAGLEKMRGAYYITTIMSFGVIVVGVFSYIYIFYTNSFISKRRKKEMGIYNILGMEKRHIAKVLAIETVFTAFVSIVGGIVAGILFFKLALMLIYRILGIQVTIEFSVPPSAVKNTVLVFGILYMMTLFYNLMQMKLANPVELLRGSSVGEKEPKTKWLMAILGVVCLGVGYAISITTEQPMKVISLFFVAVLLVIAGTYMLFTAGSIAVLKLLRKTHGFYYKKKHFIAVSTMMYRMKQNAAGLASICILSTMVMVMVSTTVCMFVGFDDEINILYPYEINVQTGYSEVKENVSEQSSDIIQFIEDTGTNVTDSESYSYLNFAMTLEKDSLTIGQKPTNASLYFLTRDNFLRMDHTLTEADVPKVEAGKILIYREKRFQSTKTLRGDQIQILGETFTVQQNGYCKNRCNGGAISFMDGVYYIVVDHMQTLQKLQKLAIAEANTENVSAYAYENVLGINMGMFYKRRDYTQVVDGRNPIVAHEFLGSSVEGKDVIIIDDMISSGESIIEVATELKRRKANRIFAAATFGLFTNGLEKFDKAYEEGVLTGVLTTNLIYQTPELLSKPYYINCDMSKYIALIIDTLNHDGSLSQILSPNERIQNVLRKYKNGEKI